MKRIVYPESWQDLSLHPMVRSELISFVKAVVEWNKTESLVRTHGADDLINFFFDIFQMDDDVKPLVGLLIFEDEVSYLERFIRGLSQHLDGWERSGNSLSKIHESTVSKELRGVAQDLLVRLQKRGTSEWVE